MIIYLTFKLESGEWQSLSAFQSIEELTNYFIGFSPKEYKISFEPEYAPEILKGIRLAKGIAQKDLAEKMSIDKGRLYQYESGKRFSLKVLEQLAVALEQKILITLEGVSDFSTELQPPKNEYDDTIEVSDFGKDIPKILNPNYLTLEDCDIVEARGWKYYIKKLDGSILSPNENLLLTDSITGIGVPYLLYRRGDPNTESLKIVVNSNGDKINPDVWIKVGEHTRKQIFDLTKIL